MMLEKQLQQITGLLGLFFFFSWAGRAVGAPFLINPYCSSVSRSALALPVTGKMAGIAGWRSSPEYGKGVTGYPVHLAVYDTCIICNYNSDVEVRKLSDGKLLWCSKIFGEKAFDLNGEGIFTIDRMSKRCVIMNVVTGSMHLFPEAIPGMNVFYRLIVNHENRTVLAYEEMPDIGMGISRDINFKIAIVDQLKGRIDVCKKFNETVRSVVSASDSGSIFLLINKTVLRIESKCSKKAVPVYTNDERIFCISIDQQQNMILAAGNDSMVYLIGLDRGFKQMWKSLPVAHAAVAEPLFVAANADVIMVDPIGNRIISFNSGKKKWEYSFPDDTRGSLFCSALADGSVLVGHGSMVEKLSNTGISESKFVIDDKITSRPIMDRNGMVYVGCQSGIVQVR